MKNKIKLRRELKVYQKQKIQILKILHALHTFANPAKPAYKPNFAKECNCFAKSRIQTNHFN